MNRQNFAKPNIGPCGLARRLVAVRRRARYGGVGGGPGLLLKAVQRRLGHLTIQMTADVYGHLFPSGDDGAELAAAERALLG